MIKALMVPIRPEHAVNILNGKKTLDLRTWIPKDYVGWVYVYITKTKPRLSVVHDDENGKTYYYLNSNWGRELNEYIPFRFWFDEYYTYHHYNHGVGLYNDDAEYSVMYGDLDKLCLDYREIENYGKGKDIYAWHIKKLEVFDEPKQLSDFYVTNKGLTYKYIKEYEERTHDYVSFRLKKAPRKMVWVYTKELENE